MKCECCTKFDRYEKKDQNKIENFILEFGKHHNRIKQKLVKLHAPKVVLVFELVKYPTGIPTCFDRHWLFPERVFVHTNENFTQKVPWRAVDVYLCRMLSQ